MGRDKKRRFKPNKKHIFGLQISQRLKSEETALVSRTKKHRLLHTNRNERGPFWTPIGGPFCAPIDSPRSSSLSFTPYRFTAIGFAVTKHLRRCGVSESEIHREINDGRY
jgi:hypothetical protein